MIPLSETYYDKRPNSALRSLSLFGLFFQTSLTLSINTSLPIPPSDSLGINCRGSSLCPSYLEAFPPDYIGALITIVTGKVAKCPSGFDCGPLGDREIYLPSDHIVCLPLGQVFLGGVCAFTQGSKVPKTGVTGALVTRKLQELREHGCLVCGSVPLGGDNDPDVRGILTVNYIGGVVCKGLCPSTHYTALLPLGSNSSRLFAGSSRLLE